VWVNHDVIVVGGSAGAVEVLLGIVAELPANLHASVFVVLHTSSADPGLLPELLAARGRLPASFPLHEEKIQRGHIYVAPPDNHLLLRPGAIEVVRGPKENGHRPAVDPLFRTASAAFGPRVIAVVISGYQDCGTAGMLSVKARGGLAIVQAPDTALAEEMPRSVVEKVPVDHIVHPLELPSLIVRLSATPAGQAGMPDQFVEQLEGHEKGKPAELVCPICQGVLTEAQPGVFEHFRCHVGHAFSLESLVSEPGEEMERALWAAVRALEEGAALSRRLMTSARGDLRRRFAEKAKTQNEQAELIRQILLHGALLSREDAPSVTDAS